MQIAKNILLSAALLTALVTVADVVMAIAETVSSPEPGFGHGRVADIAAAVTFVVELTR